MVDVAAHSLAVPYPGQCEAITPAYKKLMGLNLLKGFRAAVRERLGGIDGCTHLSELAAVVPTAAIQAFAGERAHLRSAEEKPFQLDHCHALRTDGDAVRQFYPRWYVPISARKASSATATPVLNRLLFNQRNPMKIHEYQGKDHPQEIWHSGAAQHPRL